LDWQAEVYALAVRSSFADGILRVRGMLAKPAHFPFSLPVVECRLLKSELESSSDLDLVGSTADVLLKEIAQLKIAVLVPPADSEIQASEAFAKQLQVRVQQLKSR
jgi:hypothetical protein